MIPKMNIDMRLDFTLVVESFYVLFNVFNMWIYNYTGFRETASN